MNRQGLADLIVVKLSENKNVLRSQYINSENKIGAFYIDDLLPVDIANKIFESFPFPDDMTQKKTLREFKYIAAQMDRYNPLLEEIIYAFQDERVVSLVGEICGIEQLIPDTLLYAGGISLMGDGNYLNPHIDNSHDKNRELWRVLNLLYYVSPDWKLENGGNLELWPEGLGQKQQTFESKFNRLVVMATHDQSWHSVSPIKVKKLRCCVSNYYFSTSPLKSTDRFHVTSFRGRPEQKVVDLLLRVDANLRALIRKFFSKGAYRVTHFYKKNK